MQGSADKKKSITLIHLFSSSTLISQRSVLKENFILKRGIFRLFIATVIFQVKYKNNISQFL